MSPKRLHILPSFRASKRKKAHAVGDAPGTVRVEPDAEAPSLRGIRYAPGEFVERDLAVEEAREFADESSIAWIDVEGLGDADTITRLGELFGLHPLALEDVAHPHERAKIEVYEHYLFIVSRMVHRQDEAIYIEQFSMFVGDGWVLTFQEHHGDCLEPVRERIRNGRGKIRRSGSDYLAYALLDALTDAYFPIIDAYSEAVERLEDDIIGGEAEQVVEALHQTKRALVPIRRAVFPLRDVVKFLRLDGHPLFTDATRLYLRDVDDHLALIVDQLDNLRDLTSSLMDVHYSMVSYRMNEVMKVLTVMSTIFIPLSFIVGLYGMNFDTRYPTNMPELSWQYGYFSLWVVMLVMVGSMIVFFRRKGWF